MFLLLSMANPKQGDNSLHPQLCFGGGHQQAPVPPSVNKLSLQT